MSSSILNTHDSDLITEIRNSNMSVFSRLVYLATLEIPTGKVSTYKLIAEAIGSPCSARAVGNVLKLNPYAPKVPCHRVISSSGKIGGFFGDSNIESDAVRRKIRLLESENIEFEGAKIKNLKNVIYKISLL